MGRTKLTDKQKKKIIADYMENGNYSETARLNGGISPNTVKTIVNKDEKTAKICKEKKEENTKDILEYMDSKVEDQKEIINLTMQALKEKLSNPDILMSIKDIATVYGVIVDKALKWKELQVKTGDNNKNDFANSIVEIWKERDKNEK